MAYIRVEIDLDDIADDELEEAYKRRFGEPLDSIPIDEIYNFISKHYWSPEQWGRLQDEISNAMRYGK